MNNKQEETPFFSALVNYINSDVTPFDVPGHKMGHIKNDLTDCYGDIIYKLDVNAPVGLDNLNHPVSVIKQAEALAASAFKADEAFFLVNGCTEAIQVMLLSVLSESDYIIMPRNVHKSVINALILSGATPIFIDALIDEKYQFARNLTFESAKEAIDSNPFAKAIFIIYPTYFGEVCDLERIVKYAHEHNMLVLVDEAHGSHYTFCSDLPKGASECGADLVATSMHKTGLSLTQSSILLKNNNCIDSSEIRTSINILQSTSPSNLLIASLDVARKYMYFNANQKIHDVINFVKDFYDKCKNLKYIEVLNEDYFKKQAYFDYDLTKIIISFRKINLSGLDAYRLLKSDYNIQAELGEQYVTLFIVSAATKKEDLDKLYLALVDMESRFEPIKIEMVKKSFQYPKTYMKPRLAFMSDKMDVALDESLGLVSAEQIMIYPPGIPLIIPGEQIDLDVINTIKKYIEKNCILYKDSPDNYIRVVKIKE